MSAFVSDINKQYVFFITPQPKPRMTRRDKWAKTRSLAAQRYFDYKDDLQNIALFNKFKPSDNMRLLFYLPSKSKNGELFHQKRPDIDNLTKAFLDSFLEDDSVVYHIDAWKIVSRGETGQIVVEILNETPTSSYFSNNSS